MAGQRPDLAMPPRRFGQRMPNLDGIATTRRLTANHENCRVVCYTGFADDGALAEALEAGASGFLLKTDSPGLLLHAVRAAHRNEILISPKMLKAYLARRHAKAQPPELTPGEQRLLVLIGQGLTNADSADELGLTISTVKTYLSRLLLRLDLTNRTTLAAHAHEWGIVD